MITTPESASDKDAAGDAGRDGASLIIRRKKEKEKVVQPECNDEKAAESICNDLAQSSR